MRNGFLGFKKSKELCAFLGGVAFGTAGIALLASDEAKKIYTHCTAAGIRAKDRVMEKATIIQENASDIYEDAKIISDEKKLKDAVTVIEDTSK